MHIYRIDSDESLASDEPIKSAPAVIKLLVTATSAPAVSPTILPRYVYKEFLLIRISEFLEKYTVLIRPFGQYD
jgi:hypothetical protein